MAVTSPAQTEGRTSALPAFAWTVTKLLLTVAVITCPLVLFTAEFLLTVVTLTPPLFPVLMAAVVWPPLPAVPVGAGIQVLVEILLVITLAPSGDIVASCIGVNLQAC